MDTNKQKSIEEIFIECIKKTPDAIRMETFKCFSEELLSSLPAQKNGSTPENIQLNNISIK